jgi:hypothetical protein
LHISWVCGQKLPTRQNKAWGMPIEVSHLPTGGTKANRIWMFPDAALENELPFAD